VRFRNRLRMAWLAFRLQPFEIAVEPYHDDGALRPGYECDNNWRREGKTCHNEAIVCMSRKIAKFRLVHEDHEHLCEECAARIRGKW